jgi:GNAT superfamily N-acetyltransferase
MNNLSVALSEIMLEDDKSLRLQKITNDDRDALLSIYASTRADELALTNWSEAQKNIFIESQFEAQRIHYEKYYSGAEFLLILSEEKTAGRLYLHATDQLRIVDISFLPSFRNLGYGTFILKSIQTLAVNMELPLSIHVEQFNPALRLYQRLGFIIKETVNSIYFLMEWNPPTRKN